MMAEPSGIAGSLKVERVGREMTGLPCEHSRCCAGPWARKWKQRPAAKERGQPPETGKGAEMVSPGATRKECSPDKIPISAP